MYSGFQEEIHLYSLDLLFCLHVCFSRMHACAPCPACMHVHRVPHVCSAPCDFDTQRTDDGTGFSGTGVREDCELHVGRGNQTQVSARAPSARNLSKPAPGPHLYILKQDNKNKLYALLIILYFEMN